MWPLAGLDPRIRRAEDPESLAHADALYTHAVILQDQGEHGWAEVELKKVVQAKLRLLGAANPDSSASSACEEPLRIHEVLGSGPEPRDPSAGFTKTYVFDERKTTGLYYRHQTLAIRGVRSCLGDAAEDILPHRTQGQRG